MQKRIRAVCTVLALILVLCLTACGQGISGKYQLMRMTYQGEEIDVNTMTAALGEDAQMYLELKSDGTAVMNMMGEITHMCYADGKLWPVDHPQMQISFTVADGVLTISQDGDCLVFEKTA